jgi:hypothetical protein
VRAWRRSRRRARRGRSPQARTPEPPENGRDHHVRPVRNSAAYQDFLQLEEQANPDGTIYVITDNISSHDSKSTRAWLEGHPRIRHAFIPKGACWLNLQEGWWRIFRRQALAGQDFADPDEIALPPGWPPPSSTPAPGPGSGDDPSLNTVPTADALSTPFKELSTSRHHRRRPRHRRRDRPRITPVRSFLPSGQRQVTIRGRQGPRHGCGPDGRATIGPRRWQSGWCCTLTDCSRGMHCAPAEPWPGCLPSWSQQPSSWRSGGAAPETMNWSFLHGSALRPWSPRKVQSSAPLSNS